MERSENIAMNMGNKCDTEAVATGNMSTHEGFDSPGTAISDDAVYMYLPVVYKEEDKKILRELAVQYMEYATLPIQEEKAHLWEKLNDLERVRPLLYHNELPWHEMNIGDELTLKTSTAFTQRIETELRRHIYLWRHMAADMVLEPVFYSPMIIHNSGIGLQIEEKTSATDADNNIVGHEFIPVIREESDLEKMKDPVVTVDREKTQETYEAYCDIFDGIMPVEIKGVNGFWYAPIDDVVMYMGTSELLDNLYMDPELVHASMKRLTDAYLVALDQYEKLGALGTNNKNYRVGSGAYGYSAKLGRGRAKGMHCNEMWGSCASQFFTSVSPAMQEEFCMQYEMEWLERHAFSYYGCCERLDHKMDILRKVKSLRKVSCSPWTRTEHMAEVLGRDYVVSLKPSPACFAFDTFEEEMVRKDVKGKLEILKDCNVELIIKDVSTIKYDPQRLFRWVEIVMELCEGMQ